MADNPNSEGEQLLRGLEYETEATHIGIETGHAEPTLPDAWSEQAPANDQPFLMPGLILIALVLVGILGYVVETRLRQSLATAVLVGLGMMVITGVLSLVFKEDRQARNSSSTLILRLALSATLGVVGFTITMILVGDPIAGTPFFHDLIIGMVPVMLILTSVWRTPSREKYVLKMQARYEARTGKLFPQMTDQERRHHNRLLVIGAIVSALPLIVFAVIVISASHGWLP
jgi:hypothetical protein